MAIGRCSMTHRLWRCVRCGKWSHAKRKPQFHQRPVFEEPQGETVIRHEQGYGEYGEYESTDVWYIACGNFAEYIAIPLIWVQS